MAPPPDTDPGSDADHDPAGDRATPAPSPATPQSTHPAPHPPPLRAQIREHVRLATPLAVANLGNQMLHLVDTLMLGRFSQEALGGAGIGGGLLFAITVIGVGVVMGLDALIPQALGAGNPARARHLLRQGVRVCFLVGLPLSVIVALSPRLLAVAGVAEATAVETEVYVLGRLPGIIPLLVFIALRSYLQACSITRPILIATIAANALNVAADWLLIFGDRGLTALGLPALGLPALGALGAGLASALVTVLSMTVCAIAVANVRAPDSPPRAARARRGHDWAAIRAILALGVPIGLQLALEVGGFALTAVLAGRLGTQPAAAHNVAITLASFAFGAMLGIAAATSVRVGRAVGARDRAAARRAGAIGLGIGAAFTVVSAVVFVLLAAPLASLFTAEAALIAAAVPLIQIAAVFQLSDGAQAIAAGALRGAGDTRATMWANLAGQCITVSLAVGLAFGLGLGAPGLWWGLCGGLTVVAVILLARFRWLTARDIRPAA